VGLLFWQSDDTADYCAMSNTDFASGVFPVRQNRTLRSANADSRNSLPKTHLAFTQFEE
jgi:hypothetical protein